MTFDDIWWHIQYPPWWHRRYSAALLHIHHSPLCCCAVDTLWRWHMQHYINVTLHCLPSLPPPLSPTHTLSFSLSRSATHSLPCSPLARSALAHFLYCSPSRWFRWCAPRSGWRSTLQRTATHCSALQRTATHCNALQRTPTLIPSLSTAITHLLQHTATHCNTL